MNIILTQKRQTMNNEPIHLILSKQELHLLAERYLALDMSHRAEVPIKHRRRATIAKVKDDLGINHKWMHKLNDSLTQKVWSMARFN